MKTYKVKASFETIIEVEASNKEEALEIANIQMFEDMGDENTILENELEWSVVK